MKKVLLIVFLVLVPVMGWAAEDEDGAIASLAELRAGLLQGYELLETCMEAGADCGRLRIAVGTIGLAMQAQQEKYCTQQRNSLGFRKRRSSLSCAEAGEGIWAFANSGGAEEGPSSTIFGTGGFSAQMLRVINEVMREVADQRINRGNVIVEEVID